MAISKKSLGFWVLLGWEGEKVMHFYDREE